MRGRPAALVLVLLLAAPACRTTTVERPSPAPPAVVRRAAPARAWEVVGADGVVGFVVRFEEPAEPSGSVHLVRNALHQDLGLVDGLGRAWRWRPHAEKPEWIGTGTVLEGARAILDADASALREVPLPRPASAAR